MNETLLPDRSPAAAIERTPAVVPEALAFAESMLDAIRNDGESVIVSQMDRFEERGPGGLVTVDRDRMRSAVDRLPVASRRIIESAAARIPSKVARSAPQSSTTSAVGVRPWLPRPTTMR